MPEPTTITEARKFIRKGELTRRTSSNGLARIGPVRDRVKAWVYIDREGAREQAARLTAELKQSPNGCRARCNGIPVGIKDIIDVFDMPTGAARSGGAQSFARRDATCVERLGQAGAVIMGKTVTTAYAKLRPGRDAQPVKLERHAWRQLERIGRGGRLRDVPRRARVADRRLGSRAPRATAASTA